LGFSRKRFASRAVTSSSSFFRGRRRGGSLILGTLSLPKTALLADDTVVIYPAAMRGCAKTGCDEPAEASIGLRYGDRIVVMGDLETRYDPNLLELCSIHADALSAPRGWLREDRRAPAPGTVPAEGPVPEAVISPPPAAPDVVAPGT
jgi:hypothetical protein